MKLRHKILAAIFYVLKPVLAPVMQWYAKRRMRKEAERLEEEVFKE